MKRFDNLFEQIISFENLLAGYYKARKGKRKNANVATFEFHLERELFRLQAELKDGRYRPGAYRTFKIKDPKERMISAAPFRDRVVHHALCNVIEPVFERTLIFDTYANRKGKGTHAGIRRCQFFARRYRYVLKSDIKKYFPSIDHQILKGLIARKIKCPRTLTLIDLIIDNSNPQEPIPDYFPGDDLFTTMERRKGLPMGNLTSQFFANIYLSPLDHFIKETLQIKGYARYVDDFVLFHDDKQRLHQVGKALQEFLGEQLRLRVHERKTQVFPTGSGITFLGKRIFITHRKLKRENVQRFRKRLNYRLQSYKNKQLHPDLMEHQLNSWLGHAKQAHTFHLREKIYRYIRNQGLNLCKTPHGSWRLLEQQR